MGCFACEEVREAVAGKGDTRYHQGECSDRDGRGRDAVKLEHIRAVSYTHLSEQGERYASGERYGKGEQYGQGVAENEQ